MVNDEGNQKEGAEFGRQWSYFRSALSLAPFWTRVKAQWNRLTGRHISLLRETGFVVNALEERKYVVPEGLLIKPTPMLDRKFGETVDTLWDDWWVKKQINDQPKELYSAMVVSRDGPADLWMNSFIKIWQKVWKQTVFLSRI
jgi:hypothetical protein